MSDTTNQILCFERWFDVELTRPQQLKYVPDTLFWDSNAANLIGARLYKDGQPYGGGVTAVKGYCLHEDGTMDDTIIGTQEGNEVYIFLPWSAYRKANEILKITVSVEIAGNTGTRRVMVAAICANVVKTKNTSSDQTVVPTNPSDPLVMYSVIAAAYDPQKTTGYSIGEYCTRNNYLWRCTTAVPAGGENWNSNHWQQVTVGEELTSDHTALNAEITRSTTIDTAVLAMIAAEYDPSGATTYTRGTYCRYNNGLFRCVAETSGAWTGAKWQQVTIGQSLNYDRLTAEAMMAQPYGDTRTYKVGEYCIFQEELKRCVVATPEGGETWTPAHWRSVFAAEDLYAMTHPRDANHDGNITFSYN